MNKYSTVFLALFSIIIFSCSSDDDSPGQVVPDGDFANGTLILNEGTSAGGSVSFLSQDLQEIDNSIFEDVNAGEGLGLFLQSIFFDDDKAFIISNGSNIITVVNRYTFELIGTIDSDLNVPRYGTVHNGKAYVTNQADFATTEDDFVAVIDLETFEVEQTVIVGAISEKIVNYNGKLFIQNSAFGSGNRISEFDTRSNTIVETFTVSEELSSMQLYEGSLFILDIEGVKKINLDNLEVEALFEKPENLTSIQNLRVVDDQFYYTSGTEAFSSALDATELSSVPIFDYGSDSAFGSFYGFDVNDDQIYVGDAGDFASNGTVFVYSTSGQLLSEKTLGNTAPNSFYFQ
ncbi:MAG: cell surface protein [Psychroflexus sp.]